MTKRPLFLTKTALFLTGLFAAFGPDSLQPATPASLTFWIPLEPTSSTDSARICGVGYIYLASSRGQPRKAFRQSISCTGSA